MKLLKPDSKYKQVSYYNRSHSYTLAGIKNNACSINVNACGPCKYKMIRDNFMRGFY